MQPDITGPRVNILAAWSPVTTEATVEHRSVDYNIISETSMSCPHISAVAAIIKSYHPTWTPAAIMSAIMTTEIQMELKPRHSTTDPDTNGASPSQLKNITGELTQCQKTPTPSYNFNYPSIGVSNLNGSLSIYRTVTFYGQEPAVYVASVENPFGVNVTVTPMALKFWKTGEKLTFRVDFNPFVNSNGNFVFGALTWKNGKQRVRSPIGVNVVSL
ncbi:subtilisin-like serine protease [Medicago truncatula]|uniref:Subtilisin-like serine protease n=1 Tax=Medicago truncatula TaxID=3880 RepID=A0A072UJH5_MEDTR|nr:subtilisin-like serine protease [Medicago truncatula]